MTDLFRENYIRVYKKSRSNQMEIVLFHKHDKRNHRDIQNAFIVGKTRRQNNSIVAAFMNYSWLLGGFLWLTGPQKVSNIFSTSQKNGKPFGAFGATGSGPVPVCAMVLLC